MNGSGGFVLRRSRFKLFDRVYQSQVLLHTKDSMNNSISGSLGLIATLFSITVVTTQPKVGLAQAAPTPQSDSNEQVKMGEQPATTSSSQVQDETIAKVQTYVTAGVQTATVYVRNIPVINFTMPQGSATDETKLGTQQKSPVIQKSKALSGETSESTDGASSKISDASVSMDPTARASAIAARINQLHRNGVDAKKISVSWKSDKTEQYTVKADGDEIVVINAQTFSPDTSKNLERDALQVTNRLRRLLGDASPMSQVEGKPKNAIVSTTLMQSGTVLSSVQGMASWYGPGFDGNYTASGEVFNQNALTAAHPFLPMGTRVRVTNLDTGRMVLVRINDRGPYHGGRILDLSAGAARIIGVMDSGVAPIRLEVMGR
jgi:rare lipoprotein A